MKKILVFLSLLLFFTVDCLSQDFWERVNIPNDAPVRDITTSTDGVLYSASFGIYKSTDIATTWTGINKFESFSYIYDFFDKQMLFQSVMIAQDNTIYATLLDGGIAQSLDMGGSWEILQHPIKTKNIVQEETGRIYAFTGFRLFYTDDGTYWNMVFEVGTDAFTTLKNYRMAIAPWGDIFVPYNGASIRRKDDSIFYSYNEGLDSTQLRCFAFKDGLVYAGADDNKGLFVSSDSGQTWNSVSTLPDNLTVTAIEFNTVGSFLVGTESNGVLISNDNGISWSQIEQIPKKEIYSIKHINDNLFVCTNGLYVSGDNGISWVLKNEGLAYPAVNAYNINSKNEHFAITQYNFFKSDDNGETWYTIETPFDFSKINIFIIDNNDRIYAASTDEDWFYYSKDDGKTWEDFKLYFLQFGDTLNYVTDFLMNSKGDLFFVFNKGLDVWKSSDNGNSWAFCKNGDMNDRLFIGKNDELLLYNKYTMAYSSKISKDDGLNWEKIVIKPQSYYNEKAHDILIDNELMMFAGEYTGFYVSTDSGATWERKNEGIEPNLDQNLSNYADIFKIQYIDDKIYIATGSGIYYSDNLGDTWQPLNSGTVRAKVGDLFLKNDGHFYVSSLSGVYRSVNQIVDVVEENDLANDELNIFPNPATEYIEISGINQRFKSLIGEPLDISIYNTLGQCMIYVETGLRPVSTKRFDVSGLPVGMYFIRIGNQSKMFVKY